MLSIPGEITFKSQTLPGDFQPIPTSQPNFLHGAVVEIKFGEIPVNSNNNSILVSYTTPIELYSTLWAVCDVSIICIFPPTSLHFTDLILPGSNICSLIAQPWEFAKLMLALCFGLVFAILSKQERKILQNLECFVSY